MYGAKRWRLFIYNVVPPLGSVYPDDYPNAEVENY